MGSLDRTNLSRRMATATLIRGALALPFAAAATQARAATLTLRLAHTAAATEPYQIGFENFRAAIEKAAGSAINVEIFPNSELGDETSVLKSLQNGTIAIATVANATLANFVPDLHLFDLPFLFRDRLQAYQVLDGPIGRSMAKPLAEKGFVLLGYYEAGVRNILNNRHPIKDLADFKGMKVRVVPSSINIDTFRALGADPVPLPYGELYTALQTHVVDAAEAANSNYYAQKFYEVAPYYAVVQWQILVAPVVMSKRIFDRLSPAQQNSDPQCHAGLRRARAQSLSGGRRDGAQGAPGARRQSDLSAASALDRCGEAGLDEMGPDRRPAEDRHDHRHPIERFARGHGPAIDQPLQARHPARRRRGGGSIAGPGAARSGNCRARARLRGRARAFHGAARDGARCRRRVPLHHRQCAAMDR